MTAYGLHYLAEALCNASVISNIRKLDLSDSINVSRDTMHYANRYNYLLPCLAGRSGGAVSGQGSGDERGARAPHSQQVRAGRRGVGATCQRYTTCSRTLQRRPQLVLSPLPLWYSSLQEQDPGDTGAGHEWPHRCECTGSWGSLEVELQVSRPVIVAE